MERKLSMVKNRLQQGRAEDVVDAVVSWEKTKQKAGLDVDVKL